MAKKVSKKASTKAKQAKQAKASKAAKPKAAKPKAAKAKPAKPRAAKPKAAKPKPAKPKPAKPKPAKPKPAKPKPAKAEPAKKVAKAEPAEPKAAKKAVKAKPSAKPKPAEPKPAPRVEPKPTGATRKPPAAKAARGKEAKVSRRMAKKPAPRLEAEDEEEDEHEEEVEAPPRRTRGRVISPGPTDPREALLSDALRAQRVRDFAAARRHLERFQEQFPEDVRGLIYLANLARAEGNREQALATYKAALRKAPQDPLALWWKADFHLSEPAAGELKQAQADLKKIVDLFGRRRDDVSRNWTEQAREKLRYCESRQLSLESHRYLKGRGKNPPTPRDLKKARELLRKALDVYPGDPRNHMNLGSVELQLGNVERAIKHARDALELNASYARAHLILGHAYRAQGQLSLAKDAYLQCIELDNLQRDAAEAWRCRREVEQELARKRRRFFSTLVGRPDEEGQLEPLELVRLKEWVGVLEGDVVKNADLARDPAGHYVVTAYGEKDTYRAFPGPEGLVIEREHEPPSQPLAPIGS